MIRSTHAHVHVAAFSHPGMTGKNNEDRFGVSSFLLGTTNPTPSVLAVMCDGIGGHRGGEIAAELAVNTISQIVAGSDGAQPVRILQEAVQGASRQIREQSEGNSDLFGMGSTCACAWLIANRLYIVAVGDSRIYLQRGDAIFQLTTDHTWVQELLEKGQISPNQVHNHPNAHVIRRYLGSPVPPEGDFRFRMSPTEKDTLGISNQGMALRAGDRILLCTDGLTDLVEDGEIRLTLDGKILFAKEKAQEPLHPARKKQDPIEQKLEKTIQGLVRLANQRGGHDNISVILMQVPGNPHLEKKKAVGSRKLIRAMAVFLALVVVSVFTGIGLIGLSTLGGQLRSTTEVNTLSQETNSNQAAMTLQSTRGLAPTDFISSIEPTLLRVSQTLPRAGATPGATLTPWPTRLPGQ
jgi:PPM family protein phosphatase